MQAELKRLRNLYPNPDPKTLQTWKDAAESILAPGGATSQILLKQGLLGKAEKTRPDTEYLMEIMDLNEILMQIELGGDEDQKKILKKKVRSMEKNLLLPVKVLEPKYADGSATPEEWELLVDYFSRQKYLQRFSEQLKGKL